MKILDSDKIYMFPDDQLMKEWFDEFNHRFFEDELEPIELKVGYLAKRTHGAFHAPPQDRCPGFHPDKCSILLNCRFFDSEDEWRNTFLHEMVHYYNYERGIQDCSRGNIENLRKVRHLSSLANGETYLYTYLLHRLRHPRGETAYPS